MADIETITILAKLLGEARAYDGATGKVLAVPIGAISDALYKLATTQTITPLEYDGTTFKPKKAGK